MPMIIGGGIGLLGGVGKFFGDKARADKQRKTNAEIMRWSPWTGMQGSPVQEPDAIGSALQFGTSGAMLGQGIQNQNAWNGMMDKMGSGGSGGNVFTNEDQGLLDKYRPQMMGYNQMGGLFGRK